MTAVTCTHDVDAIRDGSSAPNVRAVCVLRHRFMAPCRPLSLPCGMWMPTHTCAYAVKPYIRLVFQLQDQGSPAH